MKYIKAFSVVLFLTLIPLPSIARTQYQVFETQESILKNALATFQRDTNQLAPGSSSDDALDTLISIWAENIYWPVMPELVSSPEKLKAQLSVFMGDLKSFGPSSLAAVLGHILSDKSSNGLLAFENYKPMLFDANSSVYGRTVYPGEWISKAFKNSFGKLTLRSTKMQGRTLHWAEWHPIKSGE